MTERSSSRASRTPRSPRAARSRPALGRDSVLDAAVQLADTAGIEALTMRRLAQALGVEAMSLYYHVANKDEILGGIVDRVLGEIELPPPETPWKVAIRTTALSAHDVLTRHPWAAALMLAGTQTSQARLRYMETLLGALRRGGFSAEMTDRAYHALESHISGFTLWIVQMDIDDESLPDLATRFMSTLPADEFPYLIEHIHQHLAPRPPSEEGDGAFAFGLDLILDGLERILAAGRR